MSLKVVHTLLLNTAMCKHEVDRQLFKDNISYSIPSLVKLENNEIRLQKAFDFIVSSKAMAVYPGEITSWTHLKSPLRQSV